MSDETRPLKARLSKYPAVWRWLTKRTGRTIDFGLMWPPKCSQRAVTLFDQGKARFGFESGDTDDILGALDDCRRSSLVQWATIGDASGDWGDAAVLMVRPRSGKKSDVHRVAAELVDDEAFAEWSTHMNDTTFWLHPPINETVEQAEGGWPWALGRVREAEVRALDVRELEP